MREGLARSEVLHEFEIPSVWLSEKKANPLFELDEGEIVRIPNFLSLLQKPQNLVRSLVNLRLKIGWDRLLCAPVLPHQVPPLFYLGVDLFEPSFAELCATMDMRTTYRGIFEGAKDNILNLKEIVEECKLTLKRGELREMVETYSSISPENMLILKTIDREFSKLFQRYSPISRPRCLCSIRQSFKRPEILRFSDWVRENYIPSSNLILLLPCSARKPYSQSQSHKKILKALKGIRKYLCEFIYTSPIGIVPRELERVFPAAHYDIPVEGEWYPEEKERINKILKKVLKRVENPRVWVVGNEKDRKLFEFEIFSFHQLKNLKHEILKEINSQNPSKSNLQSSSIKTIFDYQFGIGAGERILRSTKSIKTKPLRLFSEKQLALQNKSGFFTLTLEGAKVLKEYKWIEIHDFELKGDLFVPGIKGFSSNIRVGDEVSILRKNNVVGVGRALMPTEEIREREKGLCVKVRRRI
ncbi:MAG: DUF5591 domain-containing protein [Candidatus Methanofastidiosia archaeon]